LTPLSEACERTARVRGFFFSRGDGLRAVIRLVGALGILFLVLAWRLDQAVRTAYDSGWTGNTIKLAGCKDCRLPGHAWLVVHGAGGVLAVLCFGAALSLWLWRKRGQATRDLKLICAVTASLALVLEILAAYLRDRADRDKGASLLGYAFACDAFALALLGVFAVGVAAATASAPGTVHRFRRFVQRHGVNLVAVVFLALVLDVVGQTSGQAIDSVRGWVVWDSRGMARLAFGLTTSLLLAVVVYESGVRADAIETPRRPDRWIGTWWWVGFGGPLLVVGILGGLLLPLGYGVAVLGGILVLLGLLELPHLSEQPPPPLEDAVARASRASPISEYLAIVPLLAVSAIALAGAIDAALSDGADVKFRSLLVLGPCIALVLFAVLMTGRDVAPELPRVGWGWSGAFVGVVVIAIALLLVDSERFAAAVGFVLLALMLLYTWALFHAAEDIVAKLHFLILPIAVWTGVAVAFAVHWSAFGVSDTLGVFGLVNVALAFLLALLHYLVAWSIRLRPPRFLWSLRLQQLPILSLLLLWWIGAGLVFAPRSLHDARVVERAPLATPTSLSASFAEWRSAQGAAWLKSSPEDSPLPLLVVASHGGGIRASYWTALALDCVVAGVSVNDEPGAQYEDTCTTRRRPAAEQLAAARRIFLVSGVSGGAVGLFAYARQLLAAGELGEGWIDRRLGGDFAAAPVGWGLFHDVPNHLLGIHPGTGGVCEGEHMHGQCFAQDRAAVLEQAFDRKWAGPRPYLRATWDQRFSGSGSERVRARAVPIVVDNSTVVGGKTRAVTSGVDLSDWPRGETTEITKTNVVDEHPLAGTAQVLAALCSANDMRLSTAALLASRFPYVNPSGRVNGNCEPNAQGAEKAACAEKEIDCRMSLVDGGYTDNSGLFTIEALLPSLRRMIEQSNSEHADRRKIALVLVEIDNHYRAAIGEPPSARGGASESLVPLATSFGGRAAIETFARAYAYRLLPDYCALTISPALHPGLAAPLGWELSDGARRDLRSGLVRDRDKPPKEQPIRIVRRLQQWLGGAGVGEGVDLRACLPEDPPLVDSP
jgi:hypothetical protein